MTPGNKEMNLIQPQLLNFHYLVNKWYHGLCDSDLGRITTEKSKYLQERNRYQIQAKTKEENCGVQPGLHTEPYAPNYVGEDKD